MNGFALTLGRAKGSVLLGQALSLTVPVQMEPGEGSSALCFEADVFYGDSRQDPGRISVNSEVSAQPQSANVTVMARAPVDEPVVTVYLRAGCESKTTRRYVLLAELAPARVPAPSDISSTPDSRLPKSTQHRPLQFSADGTTTANSAALPHAAKGSKAAVAGSKADAVSEANAVPKSRSRADHRPRLKLEPLDLTSDLDPVLKLSNELVVAENEDPQRRALAAALWRSLNETPQDIAGSESRRLTLESDLKGLHDITVKNRQTLEELTRRLGNAESQRYSNPLVYVLLALVILCGFAIAFMRNRASRGLAGAPWWRDDGTEYKAKTMKFGDVAVPDSDFHQVADTRKGPVATAELSSASLLQSAPEVSHIEDIDLVLDEPVNHVQSPAKVQVKRTEARPAVLIKPASLSSSSQIDFAHSMSATLRSVNTKEMLDVRQQAEFFMTLGQHDEAIALLSESVNDSADANPLVYLELLNVLHTLGRKEEYDRYRDGFSAIFNGQVPAYPNFNHSGSGLEAYPLVCQRIVTLWPLGDVVSYLEDCLVRVRKESGKKVFDLEAFRDLLLLHGVASRVASSSFDSGFMAFSTAKTSPVPVDAEPEVDIDLDLSEPHGNLIDFDASVWSPPSPAHDK